MSNEFLDQDNDFDENDTMTSPIDITGLIPKIREGNTKLYWKLRAQQEKVEYLKKATRSEARRLWLVLYFLRRQQIVTYGEQNCEEDAKARINRMVQIASQNLKMDISTAPLKSENSKISFLNPVCNLTPMTPREIQCRKTAYRTSRSLNIGPLDIYKGFNHKNKQSKISLEPVSVPTRDLEKEASHAARISGFSLFSIPLYDLKNNENQKKYVGPLISAGKASETIRSITAHPVPAYLCMDQSIADVKDVIKDAIDNPNNKDAFDWISFMMNHPGKFCNSLGGPVKEIIGELKIIEPIKGPYDIFDGEEDEAICFPEEEDDDEEEEEEENPEIIKKKAITNLLAPDTSSSDSEDHDHIRKLYRKNDKNEEEEICLEEEENTESKLPVISESDFANDGDSSGDEIPKIQRPKKLKLHKALRRYNNSKLFMDLGNDEKESSLIPLTIKTEEKPKSNKSKPNQKTKKKPTRPLRLKPAQILVQEEDTYTPILLSTMNRPQKAKNHRPTKRFNNSKLNLVPKQK